MNITEEAREAEDDAVTAVVVALARLGVPPDIQGLLLYGDERGTVGPGVIRKALRPAIAAAEARGFARARESAVRVADDYSIAPYDDRYSVQASITAAIRAMSDQ